MQVFNLQVDENGHLTTDDTLRTMVLVALFTWRRADPEDDVPDASDLKGWWGDNYPEVENDQMGSKLWQLEGMKADDEALAFAREAIADALQFMLDDGIADSITIEVEIRERSILVGRVGILRPEDPHVQWVDLWSMTLQS
jgi:phage gp46-like protein